MGSQKTLGSYLASLFEGDGHIRIQKEDAKGKKHNPRLLQALLNPSQREGFPLPLFPYSRSEGEKAEGVRDKQEIKIKGMPL